jgi:hypothetical protein
MHLQNILQMHSSGDAQGAIEEALANVQQVKEQVRETIPNALSRAGGLASQQNHQRRTGNAD